MEVIEEQTNFPEDNENGVSPTPPSTESDALVPSEENPSKIKNCLKGCTNFLITLVDMFSDLALAFGYLATAEYLFFGLTLFFVLLTGIPWFILVIGTLFVKVRIYNIFINHRLTYQKGVCTLINVLPSSPNEDTKS